MKAVVQAMAVAGGESNSGARSDPMSTGPKLVGSLLKQQIFSLGATDKYMELKNLRLELNSLIRIYSMFSTKKWQLSNHWLGRQGLQFIETLIQAEHERCNTMGEGLFDILNNKFHPQHNETIKFLQYCIFSRQNIENAEEWMGRLRIAAEECNYKKMWLKEQFIHGLNDNEMQTEIMCEHTAIKDTSLVMKWVGTSMG